MQSTPNLQGVFSILQGAVEGGTAVVRKNIEELRRTSHFIEEHRKNIEEHEGFHVISFIYCILYSVASLLSRCVCLKKEARLQNREQIEPSSGDSPFAEHANFPVIWMPCLASVTSAQSSGDAPVSTCVSRYLRTRNDSGHWISLRN